MDMNPLFNVILGGSVALAGIAIGIVKLSRPASPWHRRIGRVLCVAAIGLLVAMVSRTNLYNEPFSFAIKIHILTGAVGFILLIIKVLVAHGKILFPGLLRPIGYLLLLSIPFAGLGKTMPFLHAAYGWETITPEELMQNPNSKAFDSDCCRCHTREVATKGVGRRKPERWIKIVQPMAWAGNLTRENCRGALASLMVKPVEKGNDSSASQPPGLPFPAGPTSIYCVPCHSQERIFKAIKTPEEWRTTVARMQSNSRNIPDMKPITNEDAEKVIQFLTKLRP